MPYYICITCGTQHAASDQPPPRCAICEDERQFVNWGGQQWTTLERLRERHRIVLRREDPGLEGVGIEPAFAIVHENRASLDYLLFDVGFDYRMEAGRLAILKSGYYGVF